MFRLSASLSDGTVVFGVDCKRSTVSLAWEVTRDKLAVTVQRAKHLPTLDRFGLCDVQVNVDLGLYKQQTHVVRGGVHAEFSSSLSFPLPSQADASAVMTVTVVHVDQAEELGQTARRAVQP